MQITNDRYGDYHSSGWLHLNSSLQDLENLKCWSPVPGLVCYSGPCSAPCTDDCLIFAHFNFQICGCGFIFTTTPRLFSHVQSGNKFRCGFTLAYFAYQKNDNKTSENFPIHCMYTLLRIPVRSVSVRIALPPP